MFEGDAVLDLEHDADVAGVEPAQMLLQPLDVTDSPHEGQTYQIGMPGHEVQVFEVLRGQRGQLERAVRQVDALVGGQLFAAFARNRDLHMDLFALDVPDHAADAAVIEPHPLPGMHLREYLGQGAWDGRGAHDAALGIQPRRSARALAGED